MSDELIEWKELNVLVSSEGVILVAENGQFLGMLENSDDFGALVMKDNPIHIHKA